MTDVVIIGSGPGGVNAAYPLCEAGLNVKMIDFGNTDYKYRPLVPEKDFLRIRLSDTQQHRYFLGDEFEGILLGNIRVGTKLTPPRLHVLADTAELMPVDSNTFIANESLALGGLADSWGAGVFPFREEDFSDMPISLADLMPHYKIVAERIGISGGRDDLYPFFGEYETMMPPLCIDSNAEKILNKYHQKRQLFNKQGYYLGRAPLAVCTEPHKERNPHQYHDMDFWADTDNSVYRPRYTLNELRRYSNFSYIRNRFVQSFREREDSSVEITAQVKNSSKIENHTARTLVIAAGAISSARIVIRSLKEYGSHIPILTNSYTYIPSINLNMLGSVPRDRRSSLAQLSLLYFRDSTMLRPTLSNFFSYRSLLTFKLLKEAPLPQRECLRIMRSLMNLYGIVTIFHKDTPSPEKYCALHKPSGNMPDRLEIQYRSSHDELMEMDNIERAVKQFYRKLGCWPIKSIRRAPGSSIHYAGTLPMSKKEKALTCNSDCRLFGTRSVYIADGSLISPLPSIVPTFSIMAIANRVGTLLTKKFGSNINAG